MRGAIGDYGGCASFFFVQPASKHLPGTFTFQQAFSPHSAIRKGGADELGPCRRQLEAAQGQVRQQWGSLTNDDLEVIEGKRTELSGRLQKRYGIAKDEAERQIDAWLNTIH